MLEIKKTDLFILSSLLTLFLESTAGNHVLETGPFYSTGIHAKRTLHAK